MPVAKQFSRLRHIDSKCMKRQRARLKLERVQGWEQTLQREGMTIKWLFYTFPRVFLDIPTRSCPTRSCIRSHLRIHCSRMAGMAIFGLPLRFSLCAAKVSKWHKLVGVEGVKASTSACAQAEWLAFGTSWDTATCKIEIRVAPLKLLCHPALWTCYMQIQLDKTQGPPPPRRSASTSVSQQQWAQSKPFQPSCTDELTVKTFLRRSASTLFHRGIRNISSEPATSHA